MKEEVQRLMERAGHALEVAKKLMADGYSSDAASKVYYAMFYAAQALLKSAGIDVIKHSAVESALGYHFAKSGKLDPQYHKMFITARKTREIADYDIEEEIIKEDALLRLEAGESFLAAIKKYLEGVS